MKFIIWNCSLRKKCSQQNCSSREYMQIYLRSFFDRTRSFRINRKKLYPNWKIPFCSKSMRDTKKKLGTKIVRLEKNYEFTPHFLFMRNISFVYWWNMLLNIKIFDFWKNYTRYIRKKYYRQSYLSQEDI